MSKQIPPTNVDCDQLRRAVEDIVTYYRSKGMIITVEQVPQQPLAMVTVRPAR